MEWMQIVWLTVLIGFIILEAVTMTLVSLWFCAGSLASLAVSLFSPAAVEAQVFVFIAVSIVTLLLLRPMVRKMIIAHKVPTNADANIGKVCQVLADIHPAQFGRVKLEGLEWTAKSDMVLPAGSWCQVLSIEGAKLVVAPVQ